MRKRIAIALLFGFLVWPAAGHAQTQAAGASTPGTAKQMLEAMLTNEEAFARRKDRFMYLSKERSERTGGHVWTEKVVETNAGKLRMLVEDDGRPLSAEREAQERGRLAAIVADPNAFMKKSQAQKNDEAHSRQMLGMIPRAFLLSEPRTEGPYVRIDFRPDPAYEPQSMEERILHAMCGTMLIEPKEMRLREVEGRLPEDVSIGFGLVATVRAGSSFGTMRSQADGPEWKTTRIDADVNGKAIFFKTIAKQQHAERSDFVRVPNDLTVAQAVELIEK